jgi:hypothetical protein
MPRSRTSTIATEGSRSPVEQVRDCADALSRAAIECCRQHDRNGKVLAKSGVDAEVDAAQAVCEACDDTLRVLTQAYEEASASVHPRGADAGWWHHANTLWLASREFVRRHRCCDDSNRALKQHHGPDRLSSLHAQYELEASALLGLRQAAEAYLQDRPNAA